MVRTMASFTQSRGIIRDVREWVVGISTTNLKFISILSQPIKKIPCFFDISSIKVLMLKKSTGSHNSHPHQQYAIFPISHINIHKKHIEQDKHVNDPNNGKIILAHIGESEN